MYELGMYKQSPIFNEALFESMAYFAGGVWEVDLPTSKIKVMHHKYTPEMVGSILSLSEAMDYFKEHCHPDDIEKVLQAFDKNTMQNAKKTYTVEARAQFDSRGVKTHIASITPYNNENGKNTGLYVTFSEIEKSFDENSPSLNISEIIKERDESKEELERYLTAVSCGILQYTRYTNKLIFVNDIALDILGYSSMEQMQRQGFSGVAKNVCYEDVRKIQEAVDGLTNENESSEFEYRVRHKNGKELLCLGKARLIVPEKGEPIIQRSIIDITEYRKTATTYLETLDNLTGSNIGLWNIILNDGAPQMIGNSTMCQLLGVPEGIEPHDMYNKWFIRVNTAYKGDILQTIDNAVEGEAVEVIYPYHHPTRGDIIIRCGGHIDKAYKGKGILLRGYHQDITEYNKDLLEASELGKGFSAIFANVYEIDLATDVFVQIRRESIMQRFLGKTGKGSDLIARVLSMVEEGPYKDRLKEFMDSSTINERLKNKEFISAEYPIGRMGWTRQYIIPVSRDKRGDVAKILIVIQSIQKEKAQELERQAEIEIQAAQSQENLDIVNDIMESAFWYINYDEEGLLRNVFWSERFRKMLGYQDEKEFPNTLEAWFNSVHPDDRARVLENYTSAVSGKGLNEPKFRMRRKNGDYELFKTTARTATHPNGKLRLLAGTLVNITQQENESRDINSRLDVFLGGVKGGIKICRYVDCFPYVYISNSVAEIQGYTKEELMAFTDGEAVNNIFKDDFENVCHSIYRKLKEIHYYDCKYRVRHKDGRLIWVHDYGKLVTDANGNHLVYSLVQNIDDQENANIRLAAERAKYAEALTKNSIYNFSLDLDEGILDTPVYMGNGDDLLAKVGIEAPVNYDEVNKKMLSHYEAEILTPDGERIFSSEGLLKNFLEGKTMESVEYYLPHHDMYIRSMGLLSKDPVTGHVMANVFAMDITAEKKRELAQEHALRNALYEADRANKAKTIFLNSMSHDIRTPINAIIGFTSLANDHIDEKERLKDYLGKIQISSDHLLSLVNDVLDMSRIESGQLKIKKSDVDLFVLFNDLCNIVQTDAKRKHLNLVVDTKNIKNPNVICDRLRMNQVLLNCLSNAIKYTPAHGKILLKVTQLPCMRDGYASYRIVVKDTGIGMSEEFLQHLFEPFTREETSTVSGIQGTGLGMAITKHIVDMMDGTITASSRKGYGTEIIISFEFKLYNRQHVLKGYSEESVGNEITSIDGISILLVEDNALNSEIAETLLTELGARVKHVDDGLLAVEELSNANGREYDIILMDIQMPIMDGYEATRRIRKLPNEEVNSIPIIAMTANAFEEDRRLSLEAGMNDHISKPIEMDKLLKIIQSVIR